MDQQIKRRLTDPVKRYPYMSKSARGDKAYDLPVDLLCYIEGKITTVRNATGEQVTSTQILYFDGDIGVGSHDQFEVNGTRYPVLAISKFKGPRPGKSGSTVVYL